ncbi:hypothetical protein D5085_09785 [Ectothiorhodospiraceae bacterium BW-2]|nr:hypothetical protein D5085_09785 [Ectothiorhodospiraceae bacterium BW-2]
MTDDEILEEVRKNRTAHAAQFNYDLRAIYDDLKKSESEHIRNGYEYVEPPVTHISANQTLQPTVTALRRFRSATQ